MAHDAPPVYPFPCGRGNRPASRTDAWGGVTFLEPVVTEHDALVAAILNAPDDNTPRLVYADYLQENEQEARAEFIRASIEHDKWFDPHEQAPRAVEERKTLNQLLRLWFPDHWPIPPDERFPPEHQYTYLENRTGVALIGNPGYKGHRADISRGFVSHLICATDTLFQHGPAVLATHPITKITLSRFRVEIDAPGADHGWQIYYFETNDVECFNFRGGLEDRDDMITSLLHDVRDIDLA